MLSQFGMLTNTGTCAILGNTFSISYFSKKVHFTSIPIFSLDALFQCIRVCEHIITNLITA